MSIFTADLQNIDFESLNQKIEGLSLNDAARTIAYIPDGPEYQILAGRYRLAYIESKIVQPFSAAVLSDDYDDIICPRVARFVAKHSDVIDAIIEEDTWSRNRYTWISIRTLEKGYIKNVVRRVGEEPVPIEDVRYAIMRMAVFIFSKSSRKDVDSMDGVKKFYNLVSRGYFTPATPTWFHAGTRHPQMKSCFLVELEDNIESILQGFTDTGLISKEGGGIGMIVSKLRHSTVRSSGKSGGILPWLKMFDEQARAIDQGGHRKGAFTVFLMICHIDFMVFIDARLQEGNHDMRVQNINICPWIPDLFFKRALSNGDWSLFCPAEAPGLTDCWGEEFERLYISYENDPSIRKTTMKAMDILKKMCHNMIVCGEPFLMSADASNRKSNQQHVCVHRGSNLCLEIIEKTSPNEIAACNLASICLPKFVRDGEFDFVKFQDVCEFVCLVLNNITERNMYPVERIRTSDSLHSPIGVGTQGFADVVAMLDMSWVQEDGNVNSQLLDLKEMIWAVKYYSVLRKSNTEAMRRKTYYETFKGSPLSQGKFQFDLWREELSIFESLNVPGFERIRKLRSRKIADISNVLGKEHSWENLRTSIMKYGVLNSLVGADMPTATTAHIQGNMESFEPFTSNFGVRKVLAGDCYVYNKHIFEDMKALGCSHAELANFLVENDGNAAGLSDYMSSKYKVSDTNLQRMKFLERKYMTSYEIPLMVQSDMNTVSNVYTCQSSSFNLHIREPSIGKLVNLIIYRWLSGSKTISYYTRTGAAVDPIKYSSNKRKVVCEDDVCMMCE